MGIIIRFCSSESETNQFQNSEIDSENALIFQWNEFNHGIHLTPDWVSCEFEL